MANATQAIKHPLREVLYYYSLLSNQIPHTKFSMRARSEKIPNYSDFSE
jgi:hypothetical protein